MKQTKPTIIELDMDNLEDVLRRVDANELKAEDGKAIRALVQSYIHLTQLLQDKNTSLSRLRKMLFGIKTEKTLAVVSGTTDAQAPSPPEADTAADSSPEYPDSSPEAHREATAQANPEVPVENDSKLPPQGHGRNGVGDYTGAEKIVVPYASLQPGDPCPKCEKGTLYDSRPGVLVRLMGQPPIQAKIYELQKLRCNLCGIVFTAQSPDGVGEEKYDATAGSMIALLKYGSGMPFHRMDGLQENLGIPLPASTQWDIVRAKAERIEPAFDELTRQAADGDVVHNDDTTIKILELMDKRARQGALAEDLTEDSAKKKPSERSGMFTTGIVSTREGRRIALFFSGRKHAGENLKDLLLQRAAHLPAPIQMCDALSRNLPAGLATILAHCLAHGRRQFVDVAEQFPEECRQVLESLSVIYHNDAIARERNLSPQARLLFHQAQSGPILEELHAWLGRQFDQRRVEPNSALGGAISYLLKHWEKLTLFLRVAGAPLDNNVCERALKKAILHRKNALFYKTRQGAHVGDVFMSLIYSCEFCGANPFDYLTELERHAGELSTSPQNWMPWNYRESLEGMGDVQTPSEESRHDDRSCKKAAQGTGQTDERRAA
jgi:transposase